MPHRKLILAIALIALAVSFALSQRHRYPDISSQLTLQRVDGERLRFADLHGKPALVTFWSTSCSVCLHEVDDLNALYRQGDKGQQYHVLGIAMSYDRPDHVLQVQAKTAMQYPVFFDLQGAIAAAFGDIRTTPSSFVIDASGKIVLQMQGKIDFLQVQKTLNRLAR